MTETNANASAIYKVGDKVRILNANGIKPNSRGFKNGEVATVTDATRRGVVIQRDSDGETMGVYTNEFASIEKVADKPTKNQRISALEFEVSALKAEVEALKQVQGKTGKLRILAVDPSVTNVAPLPTPNELRKAIIAEARAFVADNLAKNHPAAAKEGVWFTDNDGSDITDEAEFIVNAEKRTVVALIKDYGKSTVYTKAIAKCAPGDVFNADIGKAIALGRALGLDVSKFEQAVQPTEVVVGQVVKDIDDLLPLAHGKVTQIECEDCRGPRGYETDEGYAYLSHAKILDDTEAQYE